VMETALHESSAQNKMPETLTLKIV
jgi:hypothetical protein